MQRQAKSSKSSQAFIRDSLDQTQFTSVLDKSVASTKRSLATIEATKTLGRDTLEKLDHQGEQIRRIQGEVDNVEYEQKKAKRFISSINSLWGTFINQFKSDPVKRDRVTETDKVVKKHKSKEKNNKKHATEVKLTEYSLWETTHVDFSGLSEKDKEKNDQVNKNLDEIDHGVSDLGKMAIKMGEELDDHNIRLNKINETTDQAIDTMRIIQGRM